MATPLELAAMRRAIALSALGLGTTSPNPSVGCVILNADGQVVGEGYHRRKGTPHAEALALADAGELAHDGTAIVTLEPCNHFGRTPPCHQALIDAGIRRVLVALIDPTSRGEGGVARLRRAGLDVEVDVLADEARLVLGPWLRAHETRRPYVHWVHLMGKSSHGNVLTDVPDVAALRASHDVILGPDGAVAEAVPGAHGDNLTLPTQVDLRMPAVILEELFRSGTRTVLLVGDTEHARNFLENGLIDRLTVYLRKVPAQRSKQPFLPKEAQLIEVTKLAAGWVRLKFEWTVADG